MAQGELIPPGSKDTQREGEREQRCDQILNIHLVQIAQERQQGRALGGSLPLLIQHRVNKEVTQEIKKRVHSTPSRPIWNGHV